MVGLERYVGSVLAQRYRIDRPIGAGGMGAVFEAFQLDLRRRVALKLLLHASGTGDLARFKTEALSVAAASHVNVVQLYEFSVEHQPPFLTMELLAGQTLRERLKLGPLPARAAVDIAVQILSALETAHGAGVIHRDLKPSNIFLASNALGIDLVKVLDFGIAKLAGVAGETATGVVVGTPAYMAPEQLLGATVDARSDVHAVGVLLYEMITGQRAFAPGVDVAVRVVRDMPPRLDPGVPRPIADAVACALAKEPGRRFGDARSMRAALDASRAALPPSTRSDATDAHTVSSDRTQTSRTLATVTGLASHAQSSTVTAAHAQSSPVFAPHAQSSPVFAAHAQASSAPRGPTPASVAFQAPAPAASAPYAQPRFTSGPAPRRTAMTTGRMVLVVALSVLLLCAMGIGLFVYLIVSYRSQLARERVQLSQMTLRSCPPPTTCAGRLFVGGDRQSFCLAPAPAAPPPYASGDEVFVRNGDETVFAQIMSTAPDGTFRVERLSGYRISVPPKDVLGRACRP